MNTINNELSKKLQRLEDGHEELLKSLLSDLVNSNTYSEESMATERFKNRLSKYVRECDGQYEDN
ncbi:hypothetical protein K2V61_11910 [Staphylococcus simulans]|uniref:hypothetical protein n=1 Tax=Staphylococcus simulans TaxID=1286 RepID=UPI001E5B93DF|nr:hypothetical protein [Staphylococcus simulans]MCD8916246.1 hypothetical protein [Staphylococcus simulans]